MWRCFVFAFVFSSYVVQAGNAAAREIRIAMAGEMAPFFYQGESGWQGLSLDVARAVLKKLGHKVVSVKSGPMARLIVMLERGEIDIHPNWSPTSERLKIAEFTTVPHINEDHAFIVLRDSKIPYDGTMASLSGRRVAAMRGWTHGDRFDTAQSLDKVFVNSVSAQVRMLAKRRVQIAVQNPSTFFFEARKEGIDTSKMLVLDPPSVSLPVFMGISKKLPDVVNFRKSLDAALREFLQSDAYRELKKKHGF